MIALCNRHCGTGKPLSKMAVFSRLALENIYLSFTAVVALTVVLQSRKYFGLTGVRTAGIAEVIFTFRGNICFVVINPKNMEVNLNGIPWVRR